MNLLNIIIVLILHRNFLNRVHSLLSQFRNFKYLTQFSANANTLTCCSRYKEEQYKIILNVNDLPYLQIVIPVTIHP